MSGDHLERLETAYATRRAKTAGTRPDIVEVLSAELRAALDELKQLRAQQKPALGSAYAAGWSDAISACRTPGWAEREAGWKRFLGDVRSDGDLQYPERKVCPCGCHPGGDCSACAAWHANPNGQQPEQKACGTRPKGDMALRRNNSPVNVGPCVKTAGHGGRVHEDASGLTWEDR